MGIWGLSCRPNHRMGPIYKPTGWRSVRPCPSHPHTMVRTAPVGGLPPSLASGLSLGGLSGPCKAPGPKARPVPGLFGLFWAFSVLLASVRPLSSLPQPTKRCQGASLTIFEWSLPGLSASQPSTGSTLALGYLGIANACVFTKNLQVTQDLNPWTIGPLKTHGVRPKPKIGSKPHPNLKIGCFSLFPL
jgi:hypothetical protein